jgi:hypothetical protein
VTAAQEVGEIGRRKAKAGDFKSHERSWRSGLLWYGPGVTNARWEKAELWLPWPDGARRVNDGSVTSWPSLCGRSSRSDWTHIEIGI